MFRSTLQRGLDKGRLRLLLVLFFAALLVPTLILIYQAYSRLKWEAFHQHRTTAEELAARVDGRLVDLIDAEEARSFGDYAFLVVAGDPAANFLQPSTLSGYPVDSRMPGLLGYFQIDAQGGFSTPLLPQAGVDAGAYGISAEEYGARLALQQRLRDVLGENRLLRARRADAVGLVRALEPAPETQLPSDSSDERSAEGNEEGAYSSTYSDVQPATRGYREPAAAEEAVPAQAAFDQLKQVLAGDRKREVERRQAANAPQSVADLELDERYEAQARTRVRQEDGLKDEVAVAKASKLAKRAPRKEQISVPEPEAEPKGRTEAGKSDDADIAIRTFESEIDPFDFSLLDSGHFVLFRTVWRDGQRYIQGALIEQRPFLGGLIETAFRDTALSRMSDLIVAYDGSVLSAINGRAARTEYLSSSQGLAGALLYQSRLSPPLGTLELIFSINSLPAGPGGALVIWVAVILLLVLCGGFFTLYRLGLGQILLARQQQDFVSAVSHELKTPLTSIRMYGEMLLAGWADEDKKQTYYDYIYHESERLSRLISNVLQLARMTRNDPKFDMRRVTAAELVDMTESKIASQVERAGFQLQIDRGQDLGEAMIRVDTDCFTQIVINLVDNAIKFSAKAERKLIELGARRQRDGTVVFSVRDHGQGIPKGQMKKIFQLFYRSESELTRETVGTGIGLALVHQLVLAMDGKVDVSNRDPGAEFQVSFPLASRA